MSATYLVVNRKTGIELRRIYVEGEDAEDGLDNHIITGGTTVTFRKNRPVTVGVTRTEDETPEKPVEA